MCKTYEGPVKNTDMDTNINDRDIVTLLTSLSDTYVAIGHPNMYIKKGIANMYPTLA